MEDILIMAPEVETAGKGTGLIALIILAIIFVLYYFLIKPRMKKKEVDVKEEKQECNNHQPLDINDEDAFIASLIASIECREEYKKNVQVVSVRRVN